MSDRVSYRLKEAAQATGVSIDLIQKAVRTTEDSEWPPPLRSHRIGASVNAPHIVLASDLEDWIRRFPQAT